MGPEASVFAGAAASTTGPVSLPFWKASGYVDALAVGFCE